MSDGLLPFVHRVKTTSYPAAVSHGAMFHHDRPRCPIDRGYIFENTYIIPSHHKDLLRLSRVKFECTTGASVAVVMC